MANLLRLTMRLFFLYIFIIVAGVIAAQKPVPYFSYKDAKSMPPICDFSSLDNQSYQLLPFTVSPDKRLPCSVSGSGQLDNYMVFPFIAATNEIEFIIKNQNCTPFRNNIIGMQVALMKDTASVECEFSYFNFPVGTESNSNDIIVKTNNLVIGNKYFLLLDGNGGAQCSFEISITKGKVPTPTLNQIAQRDKILDRIIVNGSDLGSTINICVGKDSTKFKIPKNNLSLQYTWLISPSVDGLTTPLKTNSDSLVLLFKQPGKYELKATATNDCNELDTIRLVVNVEEMRTIPEDFGKIDICSDKISVLRDSLIKLDPDKDGLFGWGNQFTSFRDGVVIDSFFNRFNCKVIQSIDITVRQNTVGRDTVVACDKYVIGSLEITSTSTTSVSVGQKTQFGCDSVVSRYVIIPKVTGSLALETCTVKGDQIRFIQPGTNAVSPPNARVKYEWRDANNQIVTDSDVDDKVFLLTMEGAYSLYATITYDTVICGPTNLGTIVYDKSALKPSRPRLMQDSITLCPEVNTFSIKVEVSNANVEWLVPTQIPNSRFNANRDSLVGTITSNKDTIYTILVYSASTCGNSDTISLKIRKIGKPNIGIKGQDSICIDRLYNVRAIGLPTDNWIYNWVGSDVTIASGSTTAFAPISVMFNKPGANTLKLTAQQSNCVMSDSTIKVWVIDSLKDFNVSCTSTPTSIVVSWPRQTECVAGYDIRTSTTNFNIAASANTSFQLNNLTSNTDYPFSITINNACGCNGLIKQFTCKTIDCSTISLDISTTGDSSFCQVKSDSIVRLRTIKSAAALNALVTYTGSGVDQTGGVNINKLALGSNKLFARLDVNGCVASDSIVLKVKPLPLATLVLMQPLCENENIGKYTLNTNLDALSSFTINGTNAPNTAELSIGKYNYSVIDTAKCQINGLFDILPPFKLDLSLTPSLGLIFYTDESVVLNAIMADSSFRKVDSLVWLQNGKVICSNKSCRTFTVNGLIPGNYRFDVIVYYGTCSISKSLDLEVLTAYSLNFGNVVSPSKNINFSFVTDDDKMIIKELIILDRWGNSLASFENVLPKEVSWDGKRNGQDLADGVYVFVLKYEDGRGRILTKMGDITLLH